MRELSKDALYKEGMAHRSRGEYDSARDKLRQCLGGSPDGEDKAFFHRIMSDCCIEQGRWEEAVQELKLAAAIDPTPMSLVKCAEFVAEYKRDPVGAAELFEAAMEMGRNVYDTPTYQVVERNTLQIMDQLASRGYL